MNCNGEPFIHIYEWKSYPPSSGSSGSSLWILVVEMVALGSTSIIYFPLFSNSELEHASDSEAFNSGSSDYLD